MFLKEIVEGNDDPEQALMVIIQILRSIEQQEQATAEGCVLSFREWLDLYGEPTKENILSWLEPIDRDIPEGTIKWAISTKD